MQLFNRTVTNNLKKNFFKGKVIVVVGPRQVGKTTVAEQIITQFNHQNHKTKIFNCDNPTDRELLENKDLEFLQTLIGTADIVLIDEGQKVKTIGQTLKLLVDHYKTHKQFLVTGSSSFNLLDKTTEPLTGRKRVYHLYPLSLSEIHHDLDITAITKQLPFYLTYGTYPEVITATDLDEKREILNELTTSQLYRDILEFQGVKDATSLRNLLKALALQIGSQVSYTELANLIGIDKNTVERYVDLLEKSFIIFRLPPYATNKRKEIRKLKKIYFYDNGIRNAIIQNFNLPDLRNDVGALWENFLIMERLKKRTYQRIFTNTYFWRTYTQQEIDLVEEKDGQLYGYEFKWGSKTPKPPKSWLTHYPNANFKVINPNNFLQFIT